MYGFEFRELIESYPAINKKFNGVFTIDNFKNGLKKSYFILINTSNSINKIGHWVTVLWKNNNEIEFFDSLAYINLKQIIKSLPENIKTINYNTTAVQPSTSINCGYYAAWYIIHRFINEKDSYKTLLNDIFYPDSDRNEKIIEAFKINN